MAKASFAGRTKTRLVPPLTYDEAAAFNTAFLKDVASNIAAAAREVQASAASAHEAADVVGYVAYGPPGSGAFFSETLPAPIRLFEAWHGNFGDCLYAAICRLLDDGHTGAVVLNSDSPTLPTSLLTETVRLLTMPGDRAVLGPSIDGGYYLLGIKARHRRLFDDIAWSTETVARQTLDRAAEIGLDVHQLPVWYDIDDVASLRILRSELCDGGSFARGLTPHDAAATRALLVGLLANTDFSQRFDEETLQPMQRAAE